jgi:hypothetical protein
LKSYFLGFEPLDTISHVPLYFNHLPTIHLQMQMHQPTKLSSVYRIAFGFVISWFEIWATVLKFLNCLNENIYWQSSSLYKFGTVKNLRKLIFLLLLIKTQSQRAETLIVEKKL